MQKEEGARRSQGNMRSVRRAQRLVGAGLIAMGGREHRRRLWELTCAASCARDSPWDLSCFLHFNFQKNFDEYVHTLKVKVHFSYGLTQNRFREGEAQHWRPRRRRGTGSKLGKKSLKSNDTRRLSSALTLAKSTDGPFWLSPRFLEFDSHFKQYELKLKIF